MPAPARRVENMFSMRYLGGDEGPAPRLHDVRLAEPEPFLAAVLEGVESLARAGVVHGDLSAYNILVHGAQPWFIDFSEALRVDRLGSSPWVRLTEARQALTRGLEALQTYSRRHGLAFEMEARRDRIIESLDRFHVLR